MNQITSSIPEVDLVPSVKNHDYAITSSTTTQGNMSDDLTVDSVVAASTQIGDSSSAVPIPASSNNNTHLQPSQIGSLPRIHFIDVVSASRSGASFLISSPTATITATLGIPLKENQSLRYSLNGGSTWVTAPNGAISNGTDIRITDIALADNATTSIFFAVFEGDVHGQISRQLITVDSTPPTATLHQVLFKETNGQLLLLGQDLNTVLGNGQTSSTDIKDRLDWSKLNWSTDGTTNDISFSLNDIASTTITSDNNLVITLTETKQTSLRAVPGYGTGDKINITAGFLKDMVGNAATGDHLSNGEIALFTTASSLTEAVDIRDDVKLAFSGNIHRGSSGQIRLYRGDGSLIEAFDAATSTALIYENNELIINPTWHLQGSTSYSITIDPGSIIDNNNTSWGGVLATKTY